LWSDDETPPANDILFDRIQEDFGRYLDAEMYEEALQLTNMVLKYYPKRAEYHNNLAVIAYMRGDYQLALKHFQDANRLNPDDQIIIGNIQYLQEKLSETLPNK
jgi:tetratricopeptide (TPR) repeat protein